METNLLEITINFADETITAYDLDPQTTLTQLRELLKEDEFILGEELFHKLGQKTYIPKSQEKNKTIQEFKDGEIAKIGIQKKMIPKVANKDEEEKVGEGARMSLSKTSTLTLQPEDGEEEHAKQPSPLRVSKIQESLMMGKSRKENIFDIMEFSDEEIRSLLNKCSYLYGFTFSSSMDVKLGTKRFFDENPNQKFDKNLFKAMNDFYERSRVTFGKNCHEMYYKGMFDEELEQETKFVVSLHKKNDAGEEQKEEGEKQPFIYAEIGFPKVTFTLSEIRSTVSSEVMNFFKGHEAITKDKLKKFFDTFGVVIPERITLGGKFYYSQEGGENAEDLGNIRKREVEIIKGLHEKIFSQKQDSQSIDEYMLKCYGGEISLKNSPSEWLSDLQKDFRSWEIIKVESWSWTFEYLNDIHRCQVQDLLRTPESAAPGENGAVSSINLIRSTQAKDYENGDHYEGEMLGDKRDGKGVMKYANGNFYDGDWKNDKMEGQGYFKWANGDMYIGGWVNGYKEGKGSITYQIGDFYEGNWVNNKLDGKGKYEWKDGRVYDGFWANHKREGKGTFRWNNGDVYDGIWVNNKMEGQGKYIWADGREYEGAWVNDKREGQGTFKWPGGQKYVGTWVNNKMEGQGVYTWGDGRMYEGAWINHKKEGKGKFVWANGEVYEGDWVNDKKQGKGKHRWVSGDVYDGDWVNDKREGKGKLNYAVGDVYEGDWVNNRMEGKGKYRWADGRIYEGDWINGKKEGKGKFRWVNGEFYEGDWVNQRMEGKGKYIWANGQTYDGEWLNNQMKKN